MKAVFDEFSNTSGLKVNLAKSNIFFCGVEEETQNYLVAQLGMSVGCLPVRYLGVPLISTRLSAKDCQPLVEKIRSKLQCWTTKYLSFAGRCELLKSVVMHMQVFWSMAFLLPQAVIKEVERLCNRFLWSGKIDTKAITMVAWKSVCLPKGEGGLGLKQLRKWNQAALCKYIWRVCANEPGIWVRWCKEELLKGKSIWQVVIPGDASWTWRKILMARQLVQNQICMNVGDGRQCSLFYDRWLEDGSIVSRMQEEVETQRWGRMTKVSDWRRDGEWCIPSSFERKYPELTLKIKQTVMLQGQDQARWMPSANGSFSIASCYELIRDRDRKVAWRNVVWAKTIFPRHSFMLWLVFKGRMKTKEMMLQKGVASDMCCLFCNHIPETCGHLFYECPTTKEIWQTVLRQMGMRRVPLEWGRERRWLTRKCRGRSRKAKLIGLACAATIYGIWLERNRRLFCNESRNVETVIAYVRKFCVQSQ